MDAFARWSHSGRWAAVFLLPALILAGCATTQPRWPGLVHGRTPAQMGEVRTVAVLPANITVSQLTAGGVSEVRDDWTQAAREHARAALESIRAGQIVYAGDLDARPDLADEIREVRALYRLIDANIMLFGLSPMAVPTRNFDFSVGSVERVLDAAGADALLLVGGTDEIFTTDRKVLAVVSVLASAALTGQAVAPSSGQAHLSAALIARDGTILWWNFVGDGEISDLRTREGVTSTIQRLLASMPRPAAPPKVAPSTEPAAAAASAAAAGAPTVSD